MHVIVPVNVNGTVRAMGDYKATLSDIKVALVMGFAMPNGQDPGDALDDYIAEHDKEVLGKAAEIAERHADHYPSNAWPPFKAEDKDVSRDRVSAAMGRQMSHIIANAIRAAARGGGAECRCGQPSRVSGEHLAWCAARAEGA
jgi:hypothetical protein